MYPWYGHLVVNAAFCRSKSVVMDNRLHPFSYGKCVSVWNGRKNKRNGRRHPKWHGDNTFVSCYVFTCDVDENKNELKAVERSHLYGNAGTGFFIALFTFKTYASSADWHMCKIEYHINSMVRLMSRVLWSLGSTHIFPPMRTRLLSSLAFNHPFGIKPWNKRMMKWKCQRNK